MNPVRMLLATLSLVPACGGGGGGGDGAPGPDAAPDAPEPSEDWSRDLFRTHLELDLAARTGRAVIEMAGGEGTGASFEIGNLEIASVTGPGGALRFRAAGGQLDVGVPPGAAPVELAIEYQFQAQADFDGWMPDSGVTFLWPTFCGNLFPCKSDPADGLTFTLDVRAPDGAEALYPASIPAAAPSYMPAVAVADFTEVALGTTPGGVALSVWHLPGQEEDAAAGTEHLLAVMTFFENTYGPYAFGDRAGTVSADWGGGDYGGMEHHPLWHVSSGSLYSDEVNAHEAAHGWFGNGVRIACWEDFVLSEGLASYLAARALGLEGVDLWPSYGCELASYCRSTIRNTVALPDTCGAIDIINHPLWSGVPYMKGAFFLREVAALIGAEALDASLAAFYQAHVGGAARMEQLIAALEADHPAEAAAIAALADGWLRQLECPVDPDTVCPP